MFFQPHRKSVGCQKQKQQEGGRLFSGSSHQIKYIPVTRLRLPSHTFTGFSFLEKGLILNTLELITNIASQGTGV
jgi:hypothetical protein